MRSIALGLALALTVPAFASPHVRVEIHHPHWVNWECKSRWAGNARIRAKVIGCAVFTNERGRIVCTIILPRGYSRSLYHHEWRTCHGWLHGYP